MKAASIDLTGRASYVGASEVPCLFGEGFKSRWRLWQEKAGQIPAEDLSDNERVFWGSHLEPAVANGLAEKMGWNLRDVRRLVVHPDEPRLACHPDREVVSHEDGPGIVEIKNVDGLYWRKAWADGPPLGYQLQLQTQLACMGRAWGAIAALVGGNRLEVYPIERHEKAVGRILREVAAFWASIDSGTEPEPDFVKDSTAIAELYGIDPEKVVALGQEADELVLAYEEAKRAEKAASKAKQEAMGRLVYLAGDAELATTPAGHRIKRSFIAGKPVSYVRGDQYRTTITSAFKKEGNAA